MSRNKKNVRARFLIHTLELKLWYFEVFPYVCMWKPCVCNIVSRPLYVSVRYLENSSFWLAEYGPGYSVWFLDFFFLLSVSVLSKKKERKRGQVTRPDVICGLCVRVWLCAMVLYAVVMNLIRIFSSP